MKHYPKILGPYDAPWGEHCVAFDKLDGSNLRFEWNSKRGWYKFGTRWRMFDHSDPEYGEAIGIFQKKYAAALEQAVLAKYRKTEGIIAFAEFFGPYSFGGKHDEEWLKQHNLLPDGAKNEPKDLVLFDVDILKRGFVSPPEFLKLFSHLHIPKVIYEGRLNEEFAQEVRHGKHPVVEGVVVKGGSGHKLWMRKIKTFGFLKRIREVFGTGWQDYWE